MAGHFIMELTSRECNRYLVEGGDIAIVPVGSVEVLGPHLPMGARCFVAEALAALLADHVDGVRVPVTPFSSAFCTFDRAGSVVLPEEVINSYLRAAMDDLLVGGFRRVLLITHLDYLRYYIPQEFYEDHRVAAAGIHVGEAISEFAPGVGEDCVIVGALRLLDKAELAQRVLAENARLLGSADGGHAEMARPPAATAMAASGLATCPPYSLPPEVIRLQRSGKIGFTYPPGSYPIPPNPALSGEAGEEALRRTAAALVPAVASLREYNEFLAKRGVTRGLMWRGWRWTT